MDMQDPTLTPMEQQGTRLTEAPDAATDAVASSAAPHTTPPQPDAEVEAEDIMSAGIEETQTPSEDASEEAAVRAQEREITAENLLADALALLEKDAADVSNDEIRRLRQHFSMLQKTVAFRAAEAAVAAEDAVMQGAEAPAPEPDPDAAALPEVESAIERIRARKAEWAAAQEALRAANLERKNAIIDEITALAADTDNVNRTFDRYRDLQAEFNAVGDVDPTEETSVWKRFQEARERYSDNLKINKELRDYDFKKNLADKEALLADVQALCADEDIISAYRRLQELHNKWRQIGPVAKELREEIWNRFREASAEINKRYQAFFEARKTQESENEAAKTLLCTQADEIAAAELRTFAAWDEATRRLQALQEEWRKIGFASKKVNRLLFTRFRATCDAFFAAKAEFFRNTREEINNNLARKQELVQRAEALKDSTDWRNAAEQFQALQKEWKEIGAVPRKHSEDLWKRFSEACDYFFSQRKKSGSGQRRAESANLKAKREIIGKLSALISGDLDKASAIAELRKLQDQWKEIGHVPFRDKEKIYEAYRSAIDAVRDHFAIAESKARRERFESSVAEIGADGNKLNHERERLLRALEGRRADLRTYENNLGFLSAKSKSGDSLIRDLERRIERLKADINELEDKIKVIDSHLD